MTRFRIVRLGAAALRMLACAGGLLACTPAVLAETLLIPGSGTPEYVLGELAKAFNRQQQQHLVIIPPTIGTAGALRDVAAGTASIGRVGRRLSSAELSNGLTFHPLARDAVAFVAGANVSVRNISRTQAVELYTGKISNWRELGGTPGPVRAIGREPSDASRQAIAQVIVEFRQLPFHEDVKVVHLDPQMIDLLDRYPTSLGFMNLSALAAAKTRLIPLELDSVAPSADNVHTGRYPVVLEFGLVYKERALTEAGRAFLRFVDSPDGRRILRESGTVPLTASR